MISFSWIEPEKWRSALIAAAFFSLAFVEGKTILIVFSRGLEGYLILFTILFIPFAIEQNR
ncbi:hypothetical protein HSX37_15160|uniref:Uncharacterized protein n=1 Tax=Dendrosporobacter quercicolus TaxID=146817 RepID=A0A1G9RQY7_9FIRM|nr:hypothetical protein [Dendrosporobacter quercicolus]NSL49374.1 hypothetical protein [Dendrosporobacter quercicolus DSM 1736]SDM25748.1 hypothetical protein SAMN04488502_10374 [Dendrosporobacter quercicolus]